MGSWGSSIHHTPSCFWADGVPHFTDMDTYNIDGKTLAECKGFVKPVRCANSENGGKYTVWNSVRGNRDTAVVLWLSKYLSSQYDEFHEFTKQDLQSCVVKQITTDEGEPLWLLTAQSTYRSIEDILALG